MVSGALKLYSVTKSTEESPSWRAKSRSSGQKMSCLL
jgi:hypothetical protein